MFLAFFAALLLGSPPASAQGRYAPPPGVRRLDRVLPQVRSRYPGTFYDAEGPYNDEGGNPHYRLKWMTPDGRIIWLDTDARTGRVIGVSHGRHSGQYAMPPRDAPPPEHFEGRPHEHPGADFQDRGYWQRNDGGHGWNDGNGGWGGNHGGHGGGRGHHGG